MNKKTLIAAIVIIIVLGVALYLSYSSHTKEVVVNNPTDTSITYKNTMYGFDFTLPANWQGYSVVAETWNGSALKNTTAQSGPKLLIRNPRWTAAAPYEDIPLLVFTIPQWNAYLAEDFSVSAAPILAQELARNNKYVFALPPRWNFDNSLGYEEATAIVAGNPLHATE